MSILSWLKAVTSGDATADFIQSTPMQFAAGEEELHGLNMKDALDAHLAWMNRLETVLSGSSEEKLSVATVASDHNCILGKWLHGDGRQQFGQKAEYKELLRTHAEFHLAVGEVLNDVENGQRERAQGRLKDIRHRSGQVQLALVRLYSTTIN